MINREKIQDDLSAWLDGELAPGREEQVRRALDDDPALSAEMDEIRAVRDLLAALPRARAPHDLADSVLHQAERASLVEASPVVANRRPLRWMRYTAAAAMLVVATTLGVMMYSELWPDSVPTGTPGISARDEGGPRETPLSVDRSDGPHGKDGAGKDGTGTGGGVLVANNDLKDKDLPERMERYGKGGKGMDAKGDRGGGIVRLGDLPAGEVNEVIYTPTVAHTQRQIEKLLTSNSIQPIVLTSTTPVRAKPAPRPRGRGNHYRAFRVTADQVRIRIDAATPEQIERIRGEIEKIRTDQRVSQMAVPGEAIAYHRSPKLTEQPGGRRHAKPDAVDEEKVARGAGQGQGQGQGGGLKAGTDSPGKDEQDKSAAGAVVGKVAQPGAGRPKDTGHVAAGAGGGQAPPRNAPDGTSTKMREEDIERRKTKGKTGPAPTKPPSDRPGRTVAQHKNGTAKNGNDMAATGDGQQQITGNLENTGQTDIGKKLAAVRLDRDGTGFRDAWKDFFGGKARTGKYYAESKPASRPSKAVAQSQPAVKPSDAQRGELDVARQGKESQSQLAGANVRALVITLNFRAVTDATMRQQMEASQKKASTTNGKK